MKTRPSVNLRDWASWTAPAILANRRDCILGGLICLAWGTTAAAQNRPLRLLIVGDSLSAEYGLERGQGWVALLKQRLQQRQPAVSVVNASISGETSAGGRQRLPELLAREAPSHVIIELGANDALRGLPLEQTRAHLVDMVRSSRRSGAAVLLVGMQVPPNYGARYTREFAATFEQVARTEGAALVPFLLKNVADAPDATRWFQADRIHPNVAAQPRLLDNVWPVLEPWLAPRTPVGR